MLLFHIHLLFVTTFIQLSYGVRPFTSILKVLFLMLIMLTSRTGQHAMLLLYITSPELQLPTMKNHDCHQNMLKTNIYGENHRNGSSQWLKISTLANISKSFMQQQSESTNPLCISSNLHFPRQVVWPAAMCVYGRSPMPSSLKYIFSLH